MHSVINLEISGFGGIIENVRALSENRSNKMYLFSFQNIENSPPNPGISWLNKWILQILYKPSNIYYSIYVDQILLYAVFDLSQQSCKTRDYCKHYFISRKMYQINETKMVPEILSLWAGGSNVKLYWFNLRGVS